MWKKIAICLAGAVFLSTVSALALDASKPPAGNFNLTYWKLTLPDATATEIKPPELNSGYTSGWFYTGSDGAMVFWAPVTGGSTANSTYPRSELRGLMDPRNSASNWTAYGTHILQAKCKVLQLPSTGKVIIGQVHGYNTDPLIKLQWYSGNVYAYFKSAPTGGSDTKFLLATPPLGSTVTYDIRVVDGLCSVTVNGKTATFDAFASNPGWKTETYYFKAGSYVQDNEGTSEEGGRVAFYELTMSHPSTSVPMEKPSITQQPASQTVSAGATATLSVAASGSSPLSYQWRSNGVPIAGATAATANAPNFNKPQVNYDVVASNAAGAATSAVATVYLNSPVRFLAPKRDGNGRMSSTLIGAANTRYIIEGSTNLTSWTAISTNTPTNGIVSVTEPGGTARRYLRAKKG